MQPEKARTHEPAGFVIRESEQVIQLLETFYKMTGDRRYLRPIPMCLLWFERVNREALEFKGLPVYAFKRPTARYYELGTNLPIYVIRTDKVSPDGYGTYLWSNTVSKGNMQGLSNIPSEVRQVVNVEPIRKEYERVSKLSNEDANIEFLHRFKNWETPPRADAAVVKTILSSMDNRGAWITDCRV